ncbi:Glycosyltransferase, GT2 family [Succiniclasticum ruminis]|uniref:Glycosyltransferase, GT2 family n=2 Tax=Succiniclasticum ruminis TaxID=40841 RepID=A0A1G6I144_9FIRM|nr:Glycosyltransferase, GT2 family [Succiniclasticum ruminis]
MKFGLNMIMNKVIAVVVTYNRIKLLKQCVEALQKQNYPCDIMIVNNNSGDGTETWAIEISKQKDIIKYMNTGDNIGGAGGFNAGMRWAVELGYEFIWLMDDDCMPYEDSLEELMIAHERLGGTYGWLSSIALWKDGKECKMNRQKLKKSFYDYMELIQYGLVEAEQATFVSLFLNTPVVKKVGLPIKEFFIWGDDIEYTRRIAIRHKIASFLVGKSKVIHLMENNSESNIAIDGVERIPRYSYAFRNENYLYRKEGWRGIVYYIARCGMSILRVFKYSKKNKIKRCYIVLSSMVRGFFFNPKIERF